MSDAPPTAAAPGRRAAPAAAPAAGGPSAARVAALDGLRGLAILLVMVNHAGNQLWDLEGGPFEIRYLRGLLGGGAVVVFFVVGGFIVTRSLVRDLERGTLDAVRFYARRLVRLGVQLVLLGAALLAVQRLDPHAPGTMRSMVQSVTHVLTYTLNLLPFQPDLEVRSEVGHLWYLSVQQQVYLLLPFALLLLGRRRLLAAGVLLVAALAVYWHRQDLVAQDRLLEATIDTLARSDGLLWGVVLALLLPWLERFRGWGPVLAVAALASLGFQLWLQEIPAYSFLGAWSLGYQFFLGIVVVALWLVPRATLTTRFLALPPFAWLGRNSLTLYLWHLPVFVVIGRNLPQWSAWERSALALAVVGVVAVVMERVVEDPTRRLLATHPLLRTPPATASGRPVGREAS